jgi:hypothetical protein
MLMQEGVDQKVLDDAELIALVRQAQDQFEATWRIERLLQAANCPVPSTKRA